MQLTKNNNRIYKFYILKCLTFVEAGNILARQVISKHITILIKLLLYRPITRQCTREMHKAYPDNVANTAANTLYSTYNIPYLQENVSVHVLPCYFYYNTCIVCYVLLKYQLVLPPFFVCTNVCNCLPVMYRNCADFLYQNTMLLRNDIKLSTYLMDGRFCFLQQYLQYKRICIDVLKKMGPFI